MDIIKQRPLRRLQNKKTSDNHPRMLVSLTSTHAQDTLGNVITRAAIVILQQRAYLEKEIQQHMAGDVSPPYYFSRGIRDHSFVSRRGNSLAQVCSNRPIAHSQIWNALRHAKSGRAAEMWVESFLQFLLFEL